MKNEKLAFVEDKIKELVPRLKELSLYGTVKYTYSAQDGDWDAPLKNFEDSGVITFVTKARDYVVVNGDDVSVDSITEIIGHPIQLEDVLEALTKHIIPDSEEEGNNFNHDITSLVRGFWNIRWKYGKPLSEQSEELINFLYDLLK